MPKRRNKVKAPTISNLVSMESTANRLQSLLTTPEIYGFSQQGAFAGLREKLVSINFAVIRGVIDRVPLLNAVINTRVDQVLKFAKYTNDSSIPGYEFYNAEADKEVNEKDKKSFSELSTFLDQTGFFYDPNREDDFADYLSMLVRDVLGIDQIATELQPNRRGETIAFWLLDGATINRVDPKKAKGSYKFKDTTRFAQVIDSKVYNEYSHDQLLFDFKNKRSDLKYRGFGYSPVEQCIDLITTLLFGYTYLRDQMMRDRVPKGFIAVMGDVGKAQLDAIRNYWYASMTGAGAAWNIPILPSGKEGVGMDFKTLAHSNRDMEYHKLMMFLSSIIAAVFSIDLAELGIKADDSTALIGESSEPRIQASKDRGLASLLSFIEQHINKIIRKVTDKYKFRFVGLEKEDEQKLAELRKTDVETFRTVNEIREMEGVEPLEDEYADVVLNPQAVSIYNQTKAKEAQAQQQQGQGGVPGAGGQPGEDENNMVDENDMADENNSSVDWDKLFKSVKDKSNVRIVIE